MPEETYRVYLAMETCLLSSHVRQIGTDIEGLHSALDDTLSLLVWVKRDLDNCLDHNPCQVCSSLRDLGRAFAEARRNGQDHEDPSIPTPAYQPSPVHHGVPGPVGEGVEGDCVKTPSSLPSLVPDATPSVSGFYSNGDEVSTSSSSSYYIFSEFGRLWAQQFRDHQSGRSSGEENLVPMDHSSLPQIQYAPSISSDAVEHAYSIVDICSIFSTIMQPLLQPRTQTVL